MQQGVFNFSFVVSRKTGVVTGSGQGHFTEATWHMQGVSTGGPFSCDVPIQTSSFRVLVSGRAAGSRIKLSLRLPNATITNAEMNCGSDFFADAQSFNALDPSLRAVGGPHAEHSQEAPAGAEPVT